MSLTRSSFTCFSLTACGLAPQVPLYLRRHRRQSPLVVGSCVTSTAATIRAAPSTAIRTLNASTPGRKEIQTFVNLNVSILTGKEKRDQPEDAGRVDPAEPPTEPSAEAASAVEQMKQNLKTETGRGLYKMRKAIMRPVFGQIKAARGIRALANHHPPTAALPEVLIL